MKSPMLTNKDLLKATRRDDLIRETARQIIKDFAEFGLEITFSGNPTHFYDELFSQMKRHVSFLLDNNPSGFFNLLYRIDVSPAEVQKYEEQKLQDNWTELITELIILRELKKVMTRDYFRTRNSPNKLNSTGNL